ncbi:MAG: YdcH family protein [Magnetococcales bacterium]|nr:YdcH family protein [Magnetococcales bacterium]MBF0584903.1 YdcH family protein [Magnetococcales bacterium]
MFEDQLQAVQELLTTSEKFRQLHDQYQAIKLEIEQHGQSRDQFALERMKKQKLMLKDQMAVLLNQHTS